MTAPAPIDEEAMRAMAAAGLSSTDLAYEFGCSRTAISRRAKRHGIEITGNKKVLPRTIRREVLDMKPQDAIEYLLNCIEILCEAQDVSVLAEVVDAGFTATESQFLILFFGDSVVTKEKAMSSLYSVRSADEIPEPKILDVMVCKIRAKLRKLGWDASIKTIWGVGYRGERHDGFLFPWERN